MCRSKPHGRVGRAAALGSRSTGEARFGLIAGAVLVSVIAAACVPVITRRSPEISGTITAGGVPLALTKVFVQTDANAPCGQSRLVAVTDDAGAFAVRTKRAIEWNPILSLGDRLHGWRLCFEHAGQTFPGYQYLSPEPVPRMIRLECELSDEKGLLNPSRSGFLCEAVSTGTSLEWTRGE